MKGLTLAQELVNQKNNLDQADLVLDSLGGLDLLDIVPEEVEKFDGGSKIWLSDYIKSRED